MSSTTSDAPTPNTPADTDGRDERHRELVRKLDDLDFKLKLKKDGL